MTRMPGLGRRSRVPTRGEAIRGVGTAVAAAAGCWYFGVNVWHAILLGCAATVASFAVMNGASTHEFRGVAWRHRSIGSEGSRNDVARLAESLHSGWEPVGLTAERRMRQIAHRRLALEGLDLNRDDHRDAIEHRIGKRAYSILSNGGVRPRLGALVHCMDVLDALDAEHYAPPRPRSRRALKLFPSKLRRTRER